MKKLYIMIVVCLLPAKIAIGQPKATDTIHESMKQMIISQMNTQIPTASNNSKGAFGEIGSDAVLTEKGFQPLHPRKTDITQGWGETGIDGVFKKNGQYYIVEAKYKGTATLSTLADGTKQMSDAWITGGNRLLNAVGTTTRQDIINTGYKRLLAEIAPDGTVVYKLLDGNANVISIFTP